MSASKRRRDVDDSPERVERDTADALAAWTEAQHLDLEEAREATSPSDRAAALRTLESLAEQPRRKTRLALLAAAGIVAVIFGYYGLTGGGRDRSDGSVMLGGEAFAELAPVGRVERYDRFAWTLKRVTPGHFGLRVWNAGDVEPVISIDDLVGNEYVPTTEELARLGASISWQVTLLSSEGRALDVGSAEASRSP